MNGPSRIPAIAAAAVFLSPGAGAYTAATFEMPKIQLSLPSAGGRNSATGKEKSPGGWRDAISVDGTDSFPIKENSVKKDVVNSASIQMGVMFYEVFCKRDLQCLADSINGIAKNYGVSVTLDMASTAVFAYEDICNRKVNCLSAIADRMTEDGEAQDMLTRMQAGSRGESDMPSNEEILALLEKFRG